MWQKYKRSQGWVWGAVIGLLGIWSWRVEGFDWLVGVDFALMLFFFWAYQHPKGWFSEQRLAKYEPAPTTYEQGELAVLNTPVGDADAWRAHIDQCASCRDFWKKDGE